ncbi:MAG: hypothetical protein Q8J92_02810 [Parvibaculum sp.]|nr:hypothetical protein [Parvibaculum sp.]MDZ4369066.1 hypothetical protein [Afipia sp.]
MMRLLIVGSNDYLLLDDCAAQWLIRRGRNIYRASAGHRRPFFIMRGRGKAFTVQVARWRVGGYQSPAFAKHLNGDVLDCRRANLQRVFTAGEACVMPQPEPPWGTDAIYEWFRLNP